MPSVESFTPSRSERRLFAKAGGGCHRSLLFAVASVAERSTPGCYDQAMALESEPLIGSTLFTLILNQRCLSTIEAETHVKKSATYIHTSQFSDSGVRIFFAWRSVLG